MLYKDPWKKSYSGSGVARGHAVDRIAASAWSSTQLQSGRARIQILVTSAQNGMNTNNSTIVNFLLRTYWIWSVHTKTKRHLRNGKPNIIRRWHAIFVKCICIYVIHPSHHNKNKSWVPWDFLNLTHMATYRFGSRRLLFRTSVDLGSSKKNFTISETKGIWNFAYKNWLK